VIEINRKTFFIIAVATLCVLLPFFCIGKMKENETGDNKNVCDIISLVYEEEQVTIVYPCITGVSDQEKQSLINDLLKEEAFYELSDWLFDGNNNMQDMRLNIEYEILYKNSNYICIKFTGLANARLSVRNIFRTVSIDMESGNRMKLSDFVQVDHDFTALVRKALQSYIDNYPDWKIVYSDMLANNDEELLRILMLADFGPNASCFSYFTEDRLGLSFETYRVAGDHYEIEMKFDEIVECLTIKLD